jgi:hypothetical protein
MCNRRSPRESYGVAGYTESKTIYDARIPNSHLSSSSHCNECVTCKSVTVLRCAWLLSDHALWPFAIPSREGDRVRYLSQLEQARLYWYLRWSQGDLALIASGFSSVLAAELNEKLTRPEPSEGFNDVIHVHPTRQRNMEFLSAQERALDRVDDERRVRRALHRLTREEREELVLAFVIETMPTRKGFGVFGNLAERTEAAAECFTARRRRLSFQIYLDRLSKRSRGRSVSEWEGRFATMIMFECEARAILVSRKYTLALEGLDADTSAA